MKNLTNLFTFHEPALTDFFGHLGAAETSCKHNSDISSQLLIYASYEYINPLESVYSSNHV